MRSAAFAVLAVVGALVAPTPTTSAASAALAGVPPDAAWLRPVDGALVRPFEEPSSVYGAGHRGADLAAAPGTPVRAANDGEVTFAGSVAGTLHVTVTHAGGLRTSYSFLQSVAVHTGDVVARGEVIGATGGTNDDHHGDVLHLGLRLGDRYLDPMLLFRPVDLTRVVHLAPTDPPDESPWTESDERRELALSLRLPVPGMAPVGAPSRDDDGCGDGIPVVGELVSAGCDIGDWIGDHAGDALATGLSTLHALAGVSGAVVDEIRAPVVATLEALRDVPAAFATALAHTPMGALALDLVEM
ncbi:MAG TPA: M23 family metallopeptidase, partial [Acidimicrobiia bacterium]|nr:M23 family metallopeptidase [Acidimicrobiia bacterium]